MQHPTRMSLKLHWMQVMVLCTFMWITCIWALGVMTAGHLMYTLSILLNRENPGAVVCTLPFLPCDIDAFVLHRQLQGRRCPNV